MLRALVTSSILHLSLRSSVANNLWCRLATVMLTKCTAENKQGLGDEVLKICRSLYNTTQMLPVEVSGCREWCPGVVFFSQLAVGGSRSNYLNT